MIRNADNSDAGKVNTVAVIIARGGSKGLPRKNVRELGGKPLVAWTIEHALNSKRVDAVVLTSDDEAILDVGGSYEIDVFARPAELSHDTATVDAAGRHGIASWEQKHDQRCHYVALLYGNIALRPADLTDRAVTKLIETEADSVQSVYRVETTHPYWMRKLTGPHEDVVEHWQPNEVYRRQDLPPVYMLNSGVLAVTRENFFNVDPAHPHNFLGDDRRAVVTRKNEVIDVDSELDLIVAEAVLKRAGSR